MNLNKDQIQSANVRTKYIAKGSFLETQIEPGFSVITHQNETGSVQLLEKEIDSSFIQFHFCLKGGCKFI